jgi:hypothetical protein
MTTKLEEERQYIRSIDNEILQREKQIAFLKNENDNLTQQVIQTSAQNDETHKNMEQLTQKIMKAYNYDKKGS